MDDESDGDSEQDTKQSPLLMATTVAHDVDVEEQDIEEVEAESVELLPPGPAVPVAPPAAQPPQWRRHR